MPLRQLVKKAYRESWQDRSMAASRSAKASASVKDIGPRCRDARKRLKLTQEALAETLDLPQSSIVRFERGDRGLETETLLKLFRFFVDRGVSVDDYILRGQGDVMRPRSDSHELLDRIESMQKQLETLLSQTGEHPVPLTASRRR